jgi:ferredoxin
VRLRGGDEFRLATRRFRLEDVAEVEKLADTSVIREVPSDADATGPRRVQEGTSSIELGPTRAEFEHDEHPAKWSVPPGVTLLQAYMDQGGAQDEPLGWECQKGVCGLCAVRILEGAEHFEPVDESSSELKTIEIAVGVEPDPKRYRLACMSRIRGRVKLCVPG